MRRSRGLVLCALVVSTACGSAAPSGGGASAAGSAPASSSVAEASPRPSPQASPTASPVADAAEAPRPNAQIPRGAGALAAALERVTRAVRRSVSSWIDEGGPSSWPPPDALLLQALYQQRIYRDLARRPALWNEVFARLPASIRFEAAAIVRANAAVFAHANAVRPSFRIKTRPPEPADVLRAYYEQAERRFGVAWTVLAAVNYVETKFGRVISNSSAGAQGPMQFLPSTWDAYGMGGDIHDPHDAILGAANYLHANGAPANVRGALYHYNPVEAYVEAVAGYASAMRRDPRLFYAMYCWQVYVLTTRGDRRVTGPGL